MNSIILWGIVAFSLAGGALIWRTIDKFFQSRAGTKRREKGAKGESKAMAALEKMGYTILEREPELRSSMWVDGKEIEFNVKVDLLIQKGDELAVVEVKTGKSVTKAHVGKTRRQLFEYFHLYNVNKLYLFNGDTDELQEILFKRVKPSIIGSTIGSSTVWSWVFRIAIAALLLWLVVKNS